MAFSIYSASLGTELERSSAYTLATIALAAYAGGEVSTFIKQFIKYNAVFALVMAVVLFLSIYAARYVDKAPSNPLTDYLVVGLIAMPMLSSLISLASIYAIRLASNLFGVRDGRQVLALTFIGVVASLAFTQVVKVSLMGLGYLGVNFGESLNIKSGFNAASPQIQYIYLLFLVAIFPAILAILIGAYYALSADLNWKVEIVSKVGEKPDFASLSNDCRVLALTDVLFGLVCIVVASISIAAVYVLASEIGLTLFEKWMSL